MTILTNLGIDKKENTDVDPPVVYTDDEPDLVFKKKTLDDEDRVFLPPQPAAVLIASRKRNRKIAQCCLVLAALLVACLGVFSGIYIYRHFARRNTFYGTCGVRGDGFELTEDIETDQRTYELIDVPSVNNFRRSTILHDFEKNYTAIVDKDSWECFVMPLNYSTVKPPKDFWDLISKLQSGYYLPDEATVRENYRVLEPPISDLSPYGYYIWRECRRFVTLRLQRLDHTPMSLVKREACKTQPYAFSAGMSVVEINAILC